MHGLIIILLTKPSWILEEVITNQNMTIILEETLLRGVRIQLMQTRTSVGVIIPGVLNAITKEAVNMAGA
jgi:hypothetical protein